MVQVVQRLPNKHDTQVQAPESLTHTHTEMNK
jgi:hypothetical protein